MPFTTTEPPFRFRRGTRPLLISMPHVGTHVPPQLAARLSDEARHVPDTDWHLERLYDFADELGASVLVATHSRYVVDLNRPPDGASLYPGQSVTGLCPLDTFDDTPLYPAGDVPDDVEIAERREAIWQPYHRQLADELARIKAQHGIAALWDAHSIRSVLPRFFEGKLPTSTWGRRRARAAIRRSRRHCWPSPRKRPASPACSTAASPAATSRAITGNPRRVCTRCNSK